MTQALSYETLKSVVAPDTVLTLYDQKGAKRRMELNLLCLKTVFGLEKRALNFPKDEEGLHRVRINLRCAPAFFFAFHLGYARLTHQGNASLISTKHQKADLKLVSALSRTGVKTILYLAEFYGMRGVCEELERLICNDAFLDHCHDGWLGREIQLLVTSKAKAVIRPAEKGEEFEQFFGGLSPYQKGIYLVCSEVVMRRRELKAAQVAVYDASLLEEITEKEVHRKDSAVSHCCKLPLNVFKIMPWKLDGQ
ncbi:hypothetical protein QFC21_001832 [Naganishia friedmannii]|uniref:Uncharacterized protein n=1 Tax=Naganishia friedmannii TaxID=89922 RepID=A0ACC2W3M0_9TREE|nr:hypothetical protein QFC21_001832 [Naganishia friedmannii]